MTPLCRRTLTQWHAVRIGLERVEAIYRGDERAPRWSDEAEFDVHAFFVTCYHLADYLEKLDGRSGYALVKESKSLSLCRDLVVNLKHAEMTSKPLREGGANAAVSGVIAIEIGSAEDDATALHHEFRVEWNGESVDALALARDCVDEWRRLGMPPHQSNRPGGATGLDVGISIIHDT